MKTTNEINICSTVGEERKRTCNSFLQRLLMCMAIVLVAVLLMVPAITHDAYAAPADGATVQYSGTSGTCTWEIYTDGTMVIRPTSGDEGTLGTWQESTQVPWYSRRGI